MTHAALAVRAVIMLFALTGVAFAAPPPAEDVATATLQAFAGVWAPQRRMPGGPGPRAARGGDATGATDSGPAARRGGPAPRPGGRPLAGDRFAVSEADADKGLDQTDMRIRAQMTPTGQAKFDEFDPLQLPSANCQTAGLPGLAVIPQLQEWTVEDDVLTIRHESYDVVRKVALHAIPAWPDARRTVLGRMTGRLSGSALVIDTTHLAAGWGGLGRNAPGSDQRTVTETYRLADADTIEGVIEVRDPLYLVRPLRIPVTLKRQPPGTTIVAFPCDVESARRHISKP